VLLQVQQIKVSLVVMVQYLALLTQVAEAVVVLAQLAQTLLALMLVAVALVEQQVFQVHQSLTQEAEALVLTLTLILELVEQVAVEMVEITK
jgi:hypothetical protein